MLLVLQLHKMLANVMQLEFLQREEPFVALIAVEFWLSIVDLVHVVYVPIQIVLGREQSAAVLTFRFGHCNTAMRSVCTEVRFMHELATFVKQTTTSRTLREKLTFASCARVRARKLAPYVVLWTEVFLVYGTRGCSVSLFFSLWECRPVPCFFVR